MTKAGGIFLLLCGLVLAAWQFHQYGSSGDELIRVTLDELVGSSAPVTIEPAKNPLRIVLTGSYEIQLDRQQREAFSYSVRLVGPGSETVFETVGTHYPQLEPEAPIVARESAHIVLGSFEVEAAGGYLLDWRIAAKDATVGKATLIIRSNVSEVSYFYAALAAIAFFLGLALAVFARRR